MAASATSPRAEAANAADPCFDDALELTDPRIFDRDFLRLPRSLVRDPKIRQEVISFAAIARWATEQLRYRTFTSAATLAETAQVDLRSFSRDLKKLEAHGLIRNRGRERFSAGPRKRRTCTIELTELGIRATREKYLMLPRWTIKRLSYAELLVFAAVASRHGLIESLAIDGADTDSREEFGLRNLTKETGLHVESVCSAKRSLAQEWGVIQVDPQPPSENGKPVADRLYLNESFLVPSQWIPEPIWPRDEPSGDATGSIEAVAEPEQPIAPSGDVTDAERSRGDSANVPATLDPLGICHSTHSESDIVPTRNLTEDPLGICHSTHSESDIVPTRNLTFAKKEPLRKSTVDRASSELTLSKEHLWSNAPPRAAGAANGSDQKDFDWGKAEAFASSLERYIGTVTERDQGFLLWIGGLVASGQITEHMAIDSAMAVFHIKPYKPMGYFVTTLKDHCVRKKIDFDELRKWKLPPRPPPVAPVEPLPTVTLKDANAL